MTSITQDTTKPEPRHENKRRAPRFWHWKRSSTAEVDPHPAATLAEWLRMAHSLLDGDGGSKPALREGHTGMSEIAS